LLEYTLAEVAGKEKAVRTSCPQRRKKAQLRNAYVLGFVYDGKIEGRFFALCEMQSYFAEQVGVCYQMTALQADSAADLNRDGRVDVIDAQLCVNVFLGSETRPEIVARADVNGDARVDVLDVQLVVNAFLSG